MVAITAAQQNVILGNRNRAPQPTRLYTIDGGSGMELEFDATVSLDDNNRSNVTRHPIETGAKITDHITVEPRTVRIRAIFSDTPLVRVAEQPSSSPFERAFRLNAIGESLDRIQTAFVNKNAGVSDTSPTRSNDMYTALLSLMANRRIVSVDSPALAPIRDLVSRERIERDVAFQEMILEDRSAKYVITGVSRSQNVKQGQSVEVDISLDEIIIVSTERSTLPITNFVTAGSTKAAGKQQTQPATKPQADKVVERSFAGQVAADAAKAAGVTPPGG